MGLIEFSYEENDMVRFELVNAVSNTLDMINDMVESMSKVFLYVGIGFAVFAGLMLMNFIAISISYKKREIGILRAIGAKSSDVFGIFFNESALIALISFICASAVTFVAAFLINNALRAKLGLLITLFTFSIRQVLLILGASLLVAFIASFLPVYKIARKKPVDAIKNG
jgi:ABC-type antimicrobial peptide transport system permease subunit